MDNKQLLSRRSFLQLSAAGFVGASWARNASAADTAPVWEKRFQLSASPTIKILQFTDVHFFNGIDKLPKQEARRRQMTLDDAKRLIDHAKPDLLIITGDLWHDNPDSRGEEFMTYAIEQCVAFGVPWAFAWGNHDQLSDYAVGHKAFSEAKGCLYAGAESNGNYVITMEDRAGAVLAHLFCLNTKNTGMHAEALDFTRHAAGALDIRGSRGMRIGAFHIPLHQYEEMWDKGIASGIIGERVCFEQEDGSSLAVLRDAGIQAVFCGHDHVNEYSGVMDGVELIYGRATGHAGYGAEKVAKGAKRYTLDPAGKSMEWASLLPDGTLWKPKAGERVENWD